MGNQTRQQAPSQKEMDENIRQYKDNN